MLQSYLILLLMPPDCGSAELDEYWKDIIDYYSKLRVKKRYLWFKQEIWEWWIKEIAEMNGFWGSNRVWSKNMKEDRLKTRGIIKFPDNPDEEVKFPEDDEEKDKERRFRVEIPGKGHIAFELNLEDDDGKEKTKTNIVRNLREISRALEISSKSS